MPRELAGLVHAESVMILDLIREHCLREGENVVIEGTLVWEPADQRLVGELARPGYREVSIVDVEVRRELAREQAIGRWWAGRQHAGDAHGDALGGLDVIDRAYPDPDSPRSVCAGNPRRLFDSETMHDLPLARLIVVDNSAAGTITETHERRDGRTVEPLRRRGEQLELDAAPSPAQLAHHARPGRFTPAPPAGGRPSEAGPTHRPKPPGLSV